MSWPKTSDRGDCDSALEFPSQTLRAVEQSYRIRKTAVSEDLLQEDAKDNTMLEDGQKIVFLGDSITGAVDGYVDIVRSMMAALLPGTRTTCINAGIGGNRVTDMLARIGDDVVSHDPDWITVSVGINDVFHGLNGTPIRTFREKHAELVQRLADQTVAKLALFTSTVIGEDLECEANRELNDYNDCIRRTARKQNALMVPMNEAFHSAISQWQRHSQDLRFTTDGIHMTREGNHLMAITLLKAWRVL